MIDKEFVSSLIGLSETNALALIEKAKLVSRITRRDEWNYAHIMNLKNNRINLCIDGGKVSEAHVG